MPPRMIAQVEWEDLVVDQQQFISFVEEAPQEAIRNEGLALGHTSTLDNNNTVDVEYFNNWTDRIVELMSIRNDWVGRLLECLGRIEHQKNTFAQRKRPFGKIHGALVERISNLTATEVQLKMFLVDLKELKMKLEPLLPATDESVQIFKTIEILVHMFMIKVMETINQAWDISIQVANLQLQDTQWIKNFHQRFLGLQWLHLEIPRITGYMNGAIM